MNLKEIVKTIAENQRQISRVQKKLKSNFHNNKITVKTLGELDDKLFFNSLIVSFFCDALQMVDDSKQLKQFSLADIRRLYEKNVSLNPTDISCYQDLVSYELNVMNNSRRAISIAKKALVMMKSKKSFFDKICRKK